MAVDKHNRLLMELVITALLLTGVSGDCLYSNVGNDVSLPCANVVYPNCSSTTWLFWRSPQPITELVRGGQIRTETSARAERLRVESDCSLHVQNVRAEDAGQYQCLQYLTEGGPEHGEVAFVNLILLTMSLSTPVIDLKPDRPVTLRCVQTTWAGTGSCFLYDRLSWVDEAGTELQGDSRYQLTKTTDCDITLTVTLQRKDNNRKWRCQAENHGEVKTFQDFTLSGPSPAPSVKPNPTSPGALGTTDGVQLFIDIVVFVAQTIMVPGTSNGVQLSIDIVVFVALTVMVAIVTIYKTRKNRPPAELKESLRY
ncbi:uncharacterized protein LOC121552087 isoform X2 [Coregonus clupeaformis]|uniref:uncharacterized protein LOC121552087 isoform X2 n=1 Tax=Coregonus clupeaformis TaxID=59861 RepID=UPI001BDFB4B9|nr:uncharacterized protein LOC121552087 isoform X2 [Coregonus clupeaformis]XP_041720727.1 uncharacterized protein LOC121552087 isoform X2 [Coregonus clupeaformis]